MLIFPGRRVSGLHGIHCARSSPPVRLQQCCLSFFFVIVFHRVGQGRFLIRVNHDNSVENAKYRGLGLLLPSLLKQIEDLFFLSSSSFTHSILLVFVVHTVLILTVWNLEPFWNDLVNVYFID